MLVLSRLAQERLLISGGQISVTVLEIKGGRVRLGITAPHDVVIRRGECEFPSPGIDSGQIAASALAHEGQ